MKDDVTLKEIDQYIIKPSKFGSKNLYFLGAAIILWLWSYDYETSEILTYISIAMAIISLVIFLKNIFDSAPKIIINKMGITDCDNDKFFIWSSVKYVSKRVDEYNKYRGYEHRYFQIELTNGETYEKDIDFCKFNDDEVKEAVNRFSGRKIGCL